MIAIVEYVKAAYTYSGVLNLIHNSNWVISKVSVNSFVRWYTKMTSVMEPTPLTPKQATEAWRQ